MTLETWPYRLLTPRVTKARLTGAAVVGGRALSGFQQTARFDGGPRWEASYENINLRGPEAILAARAWSALLAEGAQAAVIPLWDKGFSPRPLVGGKPALGGLPAPAAYGDPYGWTASLGAPLIVAKFGANAALRATSVVVTVERGSALLAGQVLAVDHATWGWRSYRLLKITGRDDQDFEVSLANPLRESVVANEATEFDVPRNVMTLAPDSAEALEPTIEGGRLAAPISARFFEAGKPD